VSATKPDESAGPLEISLDPAIQPLIASALLRKAPAQRELLLYLWKHRHQPPSEYSIGVDVFGRKEDFDPKIDATVRVQISRLRQRLKDYYEQEGKDAAQRVHIPMGEYRVEVVDAPVTVPAPIEVESPPITMVRAPAHSWTRVIIAAQTLIIASLLVAFLVTRKPSGDAPLSLHPFWSPIVHLGKPIHIIVPAPLFFRWEGLPYVVRDFNVNSAEQLSSSPFFEPLRKQYGQPQTIQLYTVASDTLAASAVARYLQDRGVHANVLDSPAATVDLLATQDTIVFVGPGTVSQLSPLTDTNFYLKPGARGVLNRNPAPGELSHYADIEHAPLRITSYGVLARLPGKTPGTRLILFASTFNPALASVATTKSELDGLAAFHKAHGGAEFFEIVIRYERNADRVLKAVPVVYRAVANR